MSTYLVIYLVGLPVALLVFVDKEDLYDGEKVLATLFLSAIWPIVFAGALLRKLLR